MKLVKNLFFIAICFVSFSDQVSAESTIDGLKGVWTSIKKFPLFEASFWKGLGRGFGAPPTGYVYSYKIYNDTDSPVWVATQDLASVMGGVFPEASGWSCMKIDPHSSYGQDYKPYYFEFFIKTTPKSYSNHMPYLQHDDVIYQLEKINLIPKDKNSKHRNCFRVYMGKKMVNGAYEHQLEAEYVGYENIISTPNDKQALSINSSMQNLTIKNSTDQDYYVGFTTQVASNSISASACQMVGHVEKDSFALLSAAGNIKTFRPGTILIFKDLKSAPIMHVSIPEKGFSNFSYTLELYQDVGQKQLSCQWQGITPGCYDTPVNRIKDITPIIASLWYQSVKQTKNSNLVDLPGTVWAVSIEKKSGNKKILGMVQPGFVLQFMIERPKIDDKNEIYFLYVDQADISKVQSFVQNFLSGKIGQEVIESYHNRLSLVMQNTQLQMNPKSGVNKSLSGVYPSQIPALVINQINSAAMAMNRGKIVDMASQTTGFLLGYDIFMPLGIGAGPFYYQLEPSYALNPQDLLPTSAVNNLFTTAPKGMPQVFMPNNYAPITYAIA